MNHDAFMNVNSQTSVALWLTMIHQTAVGSMHCAGRGKDRAGTACHSGEQAFLALVSARFPCFPAATLLIKISSWLQGWPADQSIQCLNLVCSSGETSKTCTTGLRFMRWPAGPGRVGGFLTATCDVRKGENSSSSPDSWRFWQH